VRNLHYHDSNSIILLYNGGEHNNLLKSDFPYDKFGAVVYPNPVPVKHGYLHTYALHCMEFALGNFSFDCLTIVDSDQLCIRSGYSEFIANFFCGKYSVGMLSRMAERVTPDNKDITVWPAVQAFKEYELWRPFLQKFLQGESKFAYWTFWPSSVFTADAIRDLIKIFKEDRLLQQTMQQSKIWATEEVILPTIIKLLGYEIAQNPCTYEYVRYKKSYDLQDLNNALNTATAYWMHPIERKYEHELRKNLRQRFNHYILNNSKKTINNSSTTMLTTFSLIEKIKNIEGWLSDKEADLLIAITMKACKELPSPQYILEIGSYQGKSTVLLGSVIMEYFANAKVYAIDPHEGTVGAVDQGIHSTAPTLEMFNKNIANAGLSGVVEMIKDYSYNVKWEKPISLLFIDGLHDYPNVARDFWHFSKWVSPGGYVAFHDYSDYYPGVQAFVNELLESGTYRKINTAESLAVVQKL
jgi:predicted O-methyltransferase YrrM